MSNQNFSDVLHPEAQYIEEKLLVNANYKILKIREEDLTAFEDGSFTLNVANLYLDYFVWTQHKDTLFLPSLLLNKFAKKPQSALDKIDQLLNGKSIFEVKQLVFVHEDKFSKQEYSLVIVQHLNNIRDQQNGSKVVVAKQKTPALSDSEIDAVVVLRKLLTSLLAVEVTNASLPSEVMHLLPLPAHASPLSSLVQCLLQAPSLMRKSGKQTAQGSYKDQLTDVTSKVRDLLYFLYDYKFFESYNIVNESSLIDQTCLPLPSSQNCSQPEHQYPRSYNDTSQESSCLNESYQGDQEQPQLYLDQQSIAVQPYQSQKLETIFEEANESQVLSNAYSSFMKVNDTNIWEPQILEGETNPYIADPFNDDYDSLPCISQGTIKLQEKGTLDFDNIQQQDPNESKLPCAVGVYTSECTLEEEQHTPKVQVEESTIESNVPVIGSNTAVISPNLQVHQGNSQEALPHVRRDNQRKTRVQKEFRKRNTNENLTQVTHEPSEVSNQKQESDQIKESIVVLNDDIYQGKQCYADHLQPLGAQCLCVVLGQEQPLKPSVMTNQQPQPVLIISKQTTKQRVTQLERIAMVADNNKDHLPLNSETNKEQQTNLKQHKQRHSFCNDSASKTKQDPQGRGQFSSASRTPEKENLILDSPDSSEAQNEEEMRIRSPNPQVKYLTEVKRPSTDRGIEGPSSPEQQPRNPAESVKFQFDGCIGQPFKMITNRQQLFNSERRGRIINSVKKGKFSFLSKKIIQSGRVRYRVQSATNNFDSVLTSRGSQTIDPQACPNEHPSSLSSHKLLKSNANCRQCKGSNWIKKHNMPCDRCVSLPSFSDCKQLKQSLNMPRQVTGGNK